MIKSNYEVEILVNGKPVKEYYKDGKTYVEARGGARFTIKVKNNGYRRILAVPSVDGLSVMNGKEASLHSGGYIVSAYNTITIDGWRTSDSDVAEFFFTNPEGSYAVKSDKPGNLGVIGVAIFREKEVLASFQWRTIEAAPVYPGWWPNQNIPTYLCAGTSAMYNAVNTSGGAALSPSGAVTRSMSSQELGTGFGASKQSEVTTVRFEEESSPDSVFEIFYNSHKQLELLGIEFREKVYVSPQAFPGRYCEPPQN